MRQAAMYVAQMYDKKQRPQEDEREERPRSACRDGLPKSHGQDFL